MPDIQPEALKSLANSIAGTAPGLAALLTGASPGIAIAALGRALLDDSQASLQDVAAAVQKNDGNTKTNILVAEQSCRMRLRESGSPLESLPSDVAAALVNSVSAGEQGGFADTENARAMQIKTHDSTSKWLAYGVTIGFFLLVSALTIPNKWIFIEGATKDLLFTLMGIIGTGWANIVGFYFGSSAGSQQKSQALTAAMIGSQRTANNAVDAVKVANASP